MGWTVLYIAFGIVALWLFGEVLLQYKARLRWRLLAFTGFLGVVAGALIPSVLVIGAGIAAFAMGQTFVTLSHRRGFAAGWALNGPGFTRRRREEEEAADEDPSLEVSELEAHDTTAEQRQAGYGSDGYEPSGYASNGYGADGYASNGYGPDGYEPDVFAPNGRDTGAYAATQAFSPNAYDETGYGANGYDPAAAYDPLGQEPGGYPTTNGYGAQQPAQQQSGPVYQPGPMPDETGEFSLSGYDDFGYPAAARRGIYPDQADQQQYTYPDQQQYAAYSDPYAGYDGNGQYAAASYDGFDAYGSGYGGGYGGGDQPGYGPQQSPYGNGYGSDGYGADGYGTGYGNDGMYTGEQSYYPQTPAAGGAWVPQQRDADEVPPEQQPYQPYQNGYGTADNGYYYYDDQRGY
ncbi:MAG: hypothetical protein ACRDP3_15740 [Streptomyces sp.]|uniref:hypothetical protein n=1 Tax=Streptomyces sp. TaxID=1931 RepID=UPI003D6C1BF0